MYDPYKDNIKNILLKLSNFHKVYSFQIVHIAFARNNEYNMKNDIDKIIKVFKKMKYNCKRMYVQHTYNFQNIFYYLILLNVVAGWLLHPLSLFF